MLIGNVGQDPEVRYLDNNPSGTKVASFRLATTERYRDRTSGDLRELTEWHSIVAWRNNADVVEKFVRKGTQLYIEGRLRTRSWEDQNHNKRYTTEIIVDTLQLLGRKADNPATQQGSYGQPAQAAQPYQQSAAQGYQASQPAARPYQKPYQLSVTQVGQGYQSAQGAQSYPQPAQQPAAQAAAQAPMGADEEDDLPF